MQYRVPTGTDGTAGVAWRKRETAGRPDAFGWYCTSYGGKGQSHSAGLSGRGNLCNGVTPKRGPFRCAYSGKHDCLPGLRCRCYRAKAECTERGAGKGPLQYLDTPGKGLGDRPGDAGTTVVHCVKNIGYFSGICGCKFLKNVV